MMIMKAIKNQELKYSENCDKFQKTFFILSEQCVTANWMKSDCYINRRNYIKW